MYSAAVLSHVRRACATCGSEQGEVCHRQAFVVPDDYPLPAAYDVLTCGQCGFVYADPPATQLDYDRFYSEWSKYNDANTSTGGGESIYDFARLQATARDIACALPAKSISILDAGCATGGLLTALREQRLSSLSGLDPSPACAAACRARGFSTYVGTLASAPADMPKFDCVVLSHVLEHVLDLPAFFRATKQLLTPGGYIYLETPDASRYVDHLASPFQEFNTEHINHFSTHSLESTARRFGFSPIVIEQKVLQTAADIIYPAVFGIFKDQGIAANQTGITRDLDLPRRMKAYIQASTEMMQRISLHLTEDLQNVDAITLWGAGQLAMKLMALPCLERIRIHSIVDSNSVLRGKTFRGTRVIGPSEIKHSPEPILVTTLLHTEGIVNQIRSMGLGNRIVVLNPKASAKGQIS